MEKSLDFDDISEFRFYFSLPRSRVYNTPVPTINSRVLGIVTMSISIFEQ